jgi:cellulose synthase/poly-beta-1,6-N-acetylglucosamine synthase-like glycosyltransferase
MAQPITIITSAYSSPDEFILRVVKAVKQQKYRGKIRHIIINDNPRRKISIKGIEVVNHNKSAGLAKVLNEGFKMSKTEIVVSLMDDCLPSSKDWLSTLIKPLEQPEVGATTSDVELPRTFWDKFSYFAKALTEKEQRIITPGLDEKGCAYKRSILEEFGYLNDREFKNGGEDTDLTVKMIRKYHIVHTRAKVYHYHHFTFNSRLKKEVQYARLSGLVSRKHFFSLPWNFQTHIAVKIIVGLFFAYALLSKSLVGIAAILAIIIANLRLPFQVKRLGKDYRIVFVPFLNIVVFFSYLVNYLYALLFKPTV